MHSFGEIYNVEGLKGQIPNMVKELDNLIPDDYTPCQGEVVYIVDTIAEDWEGVNQPESIVQAFGLDIDPHDEWVWEHIEEAEARLTEQAQEQINGVLPDHLGIGFGSAGWSGDYGLLLWWVEG
jgi:hypothetical protein